MSAELPEEAETVLLVDGPWTEPLDGDDDYRTWAERRWRDKREVDVETARDHWDELADKAVALDADGEPLRDTEQLAPVNEDTVLGKHTVEAALSIWRASQ